MRTYPAAGVAVDTILIPRAGTSLEKWAVVACDQFTSQPEYWQQVAELVGDDPSTLRIIYPEVFLGKEDPQERIQAIRDSMQDYLDADIFEAHDGLVYLERSVGETVRRGLVLCIDLEQYDFTKGSTSLVRATEGTIVDRLPPRVRIREGAPLELPHIMVLIDDPADSVIGALAARSAELTAIYDFELMMDSGRIRGWRVDDIATERATMDALAALGEREAFLKRYGLDDAAVLLYAMGDGNHSLATAKAIWETTKEQLGPDAMQSPTRYALVELVNIYDASLEFEPIHRVIFECHRDIAADLKARFGASMTVQPAASLEAMVDAVDGAPAGVQRFGMLLEAGLSVVELTDPPTELAVGSLQGFLDDWMAAGGAKELDYVHGTDVVHDLGVQPGNVGFYLPGMDKGELFRSVILDGALPRKTFSMGEAADKRFYLECRRIG
jgi:hypothetical protein